MRIEQPVKALRRTPADIDETDQTGGTPGANGQIARGRRRPGRAASLRSSGARTRSQRWRSPKKGTRALRRGTLAKGSRTGKKRTA